MVGETDHIGGIQTGALGGGRFWEYAGATSVVPPVLEAMRQGLAAEARRATAAGGNRVSLPPSSEELFPWQQLARRRSPAP